MEHKKIYALSDDDLDVVSGGANQITLSASGSTTVTGYAYGISACPFCTDSSTPVQITFDGDCVSISCTRHGSYLTMPFGPGHHGGTGSILSASWPALAMHGIYPNPR